jgi:hypothetical protein
LCNGTHPFTAPVPGVDPTLPSHLATRNYVDGIGSNIASIIDTVGGHLNALDIRTPLFRQSDWTQYTWSGGQKTVVDLSLSTPLTDPSKLIGLWVVERLNVAQATQSNPTPTPIYRYRQVTPGTNAGIRVDDMWLVDSSTVRVLIPNTSTYAVGYPTNAQYDIISPSQRWLRAVAIEYQTDSQPAAIAMQDVLYLPMYNDDTLSVGDVFGFWKTSRDAQIFGVQLCADTPASGAPIVVALCDGNGNVISDDYEATLASGTPFHETVFQTPYVLPRNQFLRVKVLATGNSPGQGKGLTATIIYRPA